MNEEFRQKALKMADSLGPIQGMSYGSAVVLIHDALLEVAGIVFDECADLFKDCDREPNPYKQDVVEKT
jgi:hypothetical protein